LIRATSSLNVPACLSEIRKPALYAGELPLLPHSPQRGASGADLPGRFIGFGFMAAKECRKDAAGRLWRQ